MAKKLTVTETETPAETVQVVAVPFSKHPAASEGQQARAADQLEAAIAKLKTAEKIVAELKAKHPIAEIKLPSMTGRDLVAGLKQTIALGQARRLQALGRKNRDVASLLKTHNALLRAQPAITAPKPSNV